MLASGPVDPHETSRRSDLDFVCLISPIQSGCIPGIWPARGFVSSDEHCTCITVKEHTTWSEIEPNLTQNQRTASRVPGPPSNLSFTLRRCHSSDLQAGNSLHIWPAPLPHECLTSSACTSSAHWDMHPLLRQEYRYSRTSLLFSDGS